MFICVYLWPLPGFAAPQRVVDRIVATIEGEPVTASELAELGKFQQLAGGPVVTEKELLQRRVEHWIVASDAQAARFPRPAAAEVERELARLVAQFPSADAYAARLRELGMRAASVKRLVEQQIYFARYLEVRFRPLAQADDKQVEAYYRGEFTRQMAARSASLSPLDVVREQIRELLIQREISERAGRWLDENRTRVRVVLHSPAKGNQDLP